MKAHTTAIRIKDWFAQQVVGIYQHGSDHDKPGLFPFRTEKHKRYEARHQKMETVMNYRLQ